MPFSRRVEMASGCECPMSSSGSQAASIMFRRRLLSQNGVCTLPLPLSLLLLLLLLLAPTSSTASSPLPSPRALVVVPGGAGLGHRLKYVTLLHSAARHLNRSLYVNWEISPYCTEEFRDLFVLPEIRSFNVSAARSLGLRVETYQWDMSTCHMPGAGSGGDDPPPDDIDVVVYIASYSVPASLRCDEHMRLHNEFTARLFRNAHPDIRQMAHRHAQSLGLVGVEGTSRAKLSRNDDGNAGGRSNRGRDGRAESVLVGVHFRTA